MTDQEYRTLDRLLSRLDDCDLSRWDRDFVDDMIRRLGKYENAIVVTGKQQEQLNRMEDQYVTEVDTRGDNSGADAEELNAMLEDDQDGSEETETANVGGVAGERLRAFIQRVEKLEEEKKAIADDIREVYAEAKGNGFDPKIMRHVIKLRKMDATDRQEQDAILEIYLHALGMLD